MSVHLSSSQVSQSRLIAVIQKSLRVDMIQSPLKVDGPALPGAEEGNTAPFDGREGVDASRSGRRLANHDGTGSGPGVKPGRVCGLAAMVRRAETANPLHDSA